MLTKANVILTNGLGNIYTVRQLEINNPPIWQRIFVCLRSCCVEHIASYVTEATRSKTDKKASKVGGWVIFFQCLKFTDIPHAAQVVTLVE